MHDLSSSHISSLRRRRRRLLGRAGSFLLILAISAFSLVYVWQRVQVIAVGYQVEKLKKERDDLLRVNKGLKIEAASLTSPDRIETIASRNIGMKPAGDRQVVLVRRAGEGAGKAKARPGKS